MSAPQADADPRRRLDAGLRELVELARRRAGKEPTRAPRPTRYHAREVLLPLGELLLEADEQALAPELGRLAAAVADPALREAWEAAVREELALACAEHVMGIDPRYLDHPRFDFEYAVAARERLEARLVAAEALDLSPPEETLDRVEAADRRLAPYLERAAGEGGPA